MTTFNYYQDPGHGWIAVPRKLLEELSILDQITSYSYQRKDMVYLEEDYDASTFLRAYRKHFNQDPVFREHHTNRDSRIRGYDYYRTPEPCAPSATI